MHDLIQALHDTVIDGDGLNVEVLEDLTAEELEQAYHNAWQVWSEQSKAATARLKELTPDVPWQDRMAISQAYSNACFWNVITCQLALVQQMRGTFK